MKNAEWEIVIKMKVLLFLAILIVLIQVSIMLELLHKNRKLKKRASHFDDFELWHVLAFKDALTGVHNRNAYNRRVSEIEKILSTDKFAIMLFDIDDFKKINDTKGHLAGDETLKYLAEILKKNFSSSEDRIYRIGGDEFAVLSKGKTEEQIMELLHSVTKMLEVDGKITVSKGYSMINENVKTAFMQADEMLYAEKALSK